MFYPLPMPLSEHERRLLAEMEEALSLDDPRLVLTLTGEPISPIRNKIIVGATLFLAGLAVLFGGLIAKTHRGGGTRLYRCALRRFADSGFALIASCAVTPWQWRKGG